MALRGGSRRDGRSRHTRWWKTLVIFALLLGGPLTALAMVPDETLELTRREPAALPDFSSVASVDAYRFDRRVVPAANLTRVIVPNGRVGEGHRLYRKLAADLGAACGGALVILDAAELATDPDPVGTLAGAVVIGSAGRNAYTAAHGPSNKTAPTQPQSYHVTAAPIGTNTAVTVWVRGGAALGDAYGVYRLIAELECDASSRASPTLAGLDLAAAPIGTLRLLDASAPFFDPDNKPFNWWGGKNWFERIDTDTPPYVDTEYLAAARAEFEAFLNYTLETGYSGVLLHDLAHYTSYGALGDAVYDQGGVYATRHRYYQQYLADLVAAATALNLSFYIYADCPFLTAPMAAYCGGVETTDGDDGSWSGFDRYLTLLETGLDELLTAVPGIDGIMVRTGEGGGSHDLDAYFAGPLLATTAELYPLLDTLLAVAGRHDQQIIFRTWSIGIGELGDLHTNPETYRAFIAPYEGHPAADRLIMSMKYVQGDFYSYLPYNPCIGTGALAQLVEVEAVVEYEGGSAYPNYFAEGFASFVEHHQSLPEPHAPLAGIWAWVQEGAPTGIVQFHIFLRHGNWWSTDANAYAFAALLFDPNGTTPVPELARTWLRQRFPIRDTTAQELARVLLISDNAIRKALYITPYANETTYVLDTIWLPPCLWIWWDVPSSAHAVLATVYDQCRDPAVLDSVIDDGYEAVALVDRMIGRLEALEPVGNDSYDERPIIADLATQLLYERELYALLAEYRATWLSYYHWSATGDAAARSAWTSHLAELERLRDAYIHDHAPSTLDGAYRAKLADLALDLGANGTGAASDLDPDIYIAYDLREIDQFITRAERTNATIAAAWAGAALLILLLAGGAWLMVRLRKRERVGHRNGSQTDPFAPDGDADVTVVARRNGLTRRLERLGRSPPLLIGVIVGIDIITAFLLPTLNSYYEWSVTFVRIFMLLTLAWVTALIMLSFGGTNRPRRAALTATLRSLTGTKLALLPVVAAGYAVLLPTGPTHALIALWTDPWTLRALIATVVPLIVYYFWIKTKTFSALADARWYQTLLITGTQLGLIASIIVGWIMVVEFNAVVTQVNVRFSILPSIVNEKGPQISAWVEIPWLTVLFITVAIAVGCVVVFAIVGLRGGQRNDGPRDPASDHDRE